MTKKKDGEEMEKMEFLTSKQEVADELKMSLYKLDQLLRKYPFEKSGVPSKILGTWRMSRQDAYLWFRYVQEQELRHPDARRTRPAEPPELVSIKGRA